MAAITFSNIIGTRTSIPFASTSLSTLADVTYVAATAALDLHAIIGGVTAPVDVILELEATPGTVSGASQALLFATTSMDGSVFSTGPTSGTTVTDQDNLNYIGRLPLKSNSVLQRKGFSVLAALGFMPWAIRPVVFNNCGIAFSQGLMFYTVIVRDGR